MPLLWRYLLKKHFTLFGLCLAAFIGMLLIIRFEDIIVFASSGAPIRYILLFTLYQIPYIIPFAIPISCLISSLILFRQLSLKQEITAIRASGISLKTLMAPLIFFSILLCCTNFLIASEIAPRSKALSKNLLYSAASANPLFILQKGSPIKIKNAHISVHETKSDKRADDVLIVTKNSSENKLSLILAERLLLKDASLRGKNVSILSFLASDTKGTADHIVIENQATMNTDAKNIAQALQAATWNRSSNCIGFRMLLARLDSDSTVFSGIVHEVSKRLSLAFAPFTLTLLGAAFGLNIGRKGNKKTIFTASLLSALFFMSFLAAKSVDSNALLSALLFMIPHVIVGVCCKINLHRINRGIE